MASDKGSWSPFLLGMNREFSKHSSKARGKRVPHEGDLRWAPLETSGYPQEPSGVYITNLHKF